MIPVSLDPYFVTIEIMFINGNNNSGAIKVSGCSISYKIEAVIAPNIYNTASMLTIIFCHMLTLFDTVKSRIPLELGIHYNPTHPSYEYIWIPACPPYLRMMSVRLRCRQRYT